MGLESLQDLFLHELKDVYHAEKQILKALPKMIKATENEQLQAAFEEHLEVTEKQVERLEQVFEMLGKPARGKTCEAIVGILDEGKTMMEEFKDSPALDAALASSAQAFEHFEITRYGTLKTWAKQMGKPEMARLFDQTLSEEIATDKKLTQVAESGLNQMAA